MWDNQFVKTYGSLCFTYPPVREAIVAFELLEQFGSSPVALARVSSALSIFQSRLRGSVDTNNDILLAAGFLMCHVAMKAGYKWTGHLKGLLSIALACQDPQPNIDRLAGLDMDIWLIGRSSDSLHVWSTMCSGRSGIDSNTNLPRSLLDLLASAVSGADIFRRLEAWQPDDSIVRTILPSCTLEIWHAYRLAAQLWVSAPHLHPSQLQDSTHTHILDRLWQIVEGYWLHCKRTLSENQRQVIWPIIVASCLTEEDTRRAFAEDVLSELFPSEAAFCPSNLKSLMQELWSRRRQGRYTTLDSLAREWKVELGIW
ncbi:hypothetical protein AYO21_12050 [Fonsecaea monophora]|uniref:Transcription factor domain-containing protein n=1 Tax=Fonsecaea monophora TaxID=254056 RepID=A0A177EPD7_9EURO|nr:hypothetical protein AYO21_12050 [Fonsecaea monophora]KAH0846566.1 hypothetical protein FOPE_12171 [Fonsecaea pedrosoi]OAG33843.1 hypothetical protein AYO21_12050 [Fonsecaea monophora]